MVNFEKIDEMIKIIASGEISESQSFNEFAVNFYLETKIVPLSKYLKMEGKTNKMPKIMNTKKSGELLFHTQKNEEILKFLKKRGYKEIPELNFTCVMLLRKVDSMSNWKKLLSYFEGKGTIEEINNSTRIQLLPDEEKKIGEFIKINLGVSDTELNWLKDKFKIIYENKELLRSIKKIAR
ncbi:hypothetical protein [Psychrilyobacter atlanticus]|uniref:hypothetical protein n=1 Tax=Psychrilyobacter atlanticus TaxID=271091 RepID=UPI0003FA9CB4|nr:hypothetical protein [Psychrilyobacter atlanticus]